MTVIHATTSPWLISASQLVKVFLFGICKVVLLRVLFKLVVCSHSGLGLDLGTIEPKSLIHLMSLNTNVSRLSLHEKMVTVGHGSCVLGLSMDEAWKQLCAGRLRPPFPNEEVGSCSIAPTFTLKPKHGCTLWILRLKVRWLLLAFSLKQQLCMDVSTLFQRHSELQRT